MSIPSFVVYSGDGGTGPFAAPFPYLDRAHVGVKVAGVAVGFTWTGDNAIQLDAPAAAGAAVEVRRSTPRDPLVDFTDGSILTEADLDTAALQQLYVSQEAFDAVENAIALGATGQFDADGRRIENLGAPTSAGDAANKAYVDAVTGAGQAASAAASAAAAALSESEAGSARAAAEAAQLAAEAAAAGLPEAPFQAENLADGAVTSAKIAAGAVATAEIGDDAVTFPKLLDATGACVIGANAAGEFGEIAAATDAEMEAGIEPALRAMSPEGVSRAIASLAVGGPPPGAVVWFATSAPPSGYLECDGSAISRTAYADLFAVIGTVFGSGDGSTTFDVPDLRGEFIRGWDHGRGVDGSRAFGTFQTDAFESHSHGVLQGVNGEGSTAPNLSGQAWGAYTLYSQSVGGAETRPRNVALLPCIKF